MGIQMVKARLALVFLAAQYFRTDTFFAVITGGTFIFTKVHDVGILITYGPPSSVYPAN